jgi:hypothetical protein
MVGGPFIATIGVKGQGGMMMKKFSLRKNSLKEARGLPRL